MTLVEVVAGLALMATLLVAMILLKSRLTQSLADSKLRRAGIAAADGLLSNWWVEPRSFPVNATGPVPGTPGMIWRTAVVPDPVMARLASKKVRLDILSKNRVITTVEVMLPSEART